MRKKMLAATGWPEGKERILQIEINTRSHSVEHWLWKRLLTYRKSDYVIVIIIIIVIILIIITSCD
jgi:hypothetical protein